MGFYVIIFTLPILIGQWVGIVGLGRGQRNAAWWCMLTGVCCTTLGSIGSALFIAMMTAKATPGLGSLSMGTFAGMGASLLSGLGSLLFAIGFALHGQQGSKISQRVTELKAIATAQSEELNRLRTAQGRVS